MSTTEHEPLLTVKDVAVLLKCTIVQVYRMVDSGRIAFVNIGIGKRNRVIRFCRDNIDDLLAGRYQPDPKAQLAQRLKEMPEQDSKPVNMADRLAQKRLMKNHGIKS